MAKIYGASAQYHQASDLATLMGQQFQQQTAVGQWPPVWNAGYWTYNFDFKNFFHPYVGALIQQLNETDVDGLMSSSFLGRVAD